MRVLLIGGSKSGKSHLAQELCRTLSTGGTMIYWATMEPTDQEDRDRISAHLTDRDGWGFQTVERGRDLPGALPQVPPDAAVLFDSVTAVLANEMFCPAPDDTAPERVAADLLRVSAHSAHFVCVCDDLWRDGAFYDQLTEQYRKGLASICRRLASAFDGVYEITAGLVKPWKGAWPL